MVNTGEREDVKSGETRQLADYKSDRALMTPKLQTNDNIASSADKLVTTGGNSHEHPAVLDQLSGGGSRETDPGKLRAPGHKDEIRIDDTRPAQFESKKQMSIEENSRTDHGQGLSNASALSPLSPERVPM